MCVLLVRLEIIHPRGRVYTSVLVFARVLVLVFLRVLVLVIAL